MIKAILFFFCIINKSAYALPVSDEKWKLTYESINKDIENIFQTKKKDFFLSLRLFQLYSEKLNLLIDVENNLILENLDENPLATEKQKQVRNLINENQNKIKSLSLLLLEKSDDKSIHSQIYYFTGLNHYNLKQYKQFHYNFAKASEICTNEELCHKINTKLADYYYNESQFSEAIKLYLEIIKKDSPWLSKTLFNLAWSYFKSNDYKNAIHYLDQAKKYSDNSKYFPLGKQLYKSIYAFFPHDRNADENIKYFKDNNLYTFEHLIELAKSTFEFGKQSSVKVIFNEMDTLKKSLDEEVKLLELKIRTLRSLKDYNAINTNINKFLNNFEKTDLSAIDGEIKELILQSTLDYNGFLQEILKSLKNYPELNTDLILKYIHTNTVLLKKIKPDSSLRFSFYEGESQFTAKNYKNSISIYLTSIDQIINQDKISPIRSAEITLYIQRTFESLFKVLETYKDEKATTIAFFRYLHFYPKNAKAKEIYKRLVSPQIKADNIKQSTALLTRYSQAFPEDLKIQQDYFKRLINNSIQNKNVKKLANLNNMIAQDFLSLKNELYNKISHTIGVIELNLVELDFNKLPPNDIIAKLDYLKNEYKHNYIIYHSVLMKKITFSHEKKMYSSLPGQLDEIFKSSNNLDLVKYNINLNFYLNQICLHSSLNICFNSIQNSQIHNFKLNKENEEILFRNIIAHNDFENAFKMLNSTERKDYLFNSLILLNPNGDNLLFNRFEKSYINSLSFILEQKMWRNYFKSNSLSNMRNFNNNIKVDSIRNRLAPLITNLQNALKAIELQLPLPPTIAVVEKSKINNDETQEITFQQFSSFLEEFAKKFEIEFAKIDSQMNHIHPNFIRLYISKTINHIDEKISLYRDYKPQTSNKDLEEAIIEERNKIVNLLLQKRSSYLQFLNKSWSKVSNNVGKDFSIINVSDELDKDINKEILKWQNF